MKAIGGTRKKSMMTSMLAMAGIAALFGGDKGREAVKMSMRPGYFGGGGGSPEFYPRHGWKGKRRTNRHKFTFKAKLKRRGVR